jgi:MYXO-CTERM domain-containing protein
VSGACEPLPDGGVGGNAGSTGAGGGTGADASTGAAGNTGTGASTGAAGRGGTSGQTGAGGRSAGGAVAAADAGKPDATSESPLSLPKDEGGCGCTTPGRDKPLHAIRAASMLGLALIFSRRRQRRSDRRTCTRIG